MDAVLGWAGELVRWFASWIPRLKVIKLGERGVKYQCGKRVLVLEAGLHVYMPALTPVEVFPVVRQVMDLEPQVLMTKDKETVVANGVLVFCITNIRQFLVNNHDALAAAEEVACTALRKTVLSKTLDEIQCGRADIDNALSRETSKLMKDFGIRVLYMRLKSFAKAKVLSVTGVALTSGGPG